MPRILFIIGLSMFNYWVGVAVGKSIQRENDEKLVPTLKGMPQKAA